MMKTEKKNNPKKAITKAEAIKALRSHDPTKPLSEAPKIVQELLKTPKRSQNPNTARTHGEWYKGYLDFDDMESWVKSCYDSSIFLRVFFNQIEQIPDYKDQYIAWDIYEFLIKKYCPSNDFNNEILRKIHYAKKILIEYKSVKIRKGSYRKYLNMAAINNERKTK